MPPSEPSPGPKTRALRVLIVEDERLVAMDISDQLTRLGYDVTATVDNGEEAIAHAQTIQIDLVLMDIHIRGPIDGIETAHQLRELLNLPVIFLTAHADDATIERAAMSEPFGYVLKPFSEGELRSAIGMALYRHRAESRLRMMERWLATTLKSIGDGVIATDREGRITFLNAMAESLTSWSRSEALGRDLSEVFVTLRQDGSSESLRLVERALSEGLLITLGEGTFLESRSGVRIPIDDSAAPIRDHKGMITGCVIIFRDNSVRVEERRRLETRMQETQKLESLGVLASGLAHDFNNLLTGVLGNASLARMEMPPASPAQPFLEQIEVAALRAADLCKQMLAYAGKGRFVIRDIDLTALVAETAQLMQTSIGKNAFLNLKLGSGLPAVRVDATQIRQIVMNLLMNASEAIGGGEGEISVKTGLMHADRSYLDDAVFAPDLAEGEYAFLEVADDGCGMSPETLEKIFDPFFTTKFTGRGLGLAATLGIIRSHGGALKVSSEAGKGTTFMVLLPCSGQAAGKTYAGERDGCDARNWRGSGTVLVIDDEPAILLTATRMLESLGFAVRCAPDGRAGLEVFRVFQEEIRAVLLDLTMPRLGGAGAFSELRRLNPKVRVLLMSGFDEQESVVSFVGKGLAGFLQKPFKLEDVRARMREVLDL